MNRQKKMLIVFMLVFLMMMQCVLPVFKVAAVDNSSSKYIFNQQLYTALKSELTDQGIDATYIDEQRSIIISQNEIQKITKLTLSNFDLEDLRGLEIFTNVKRLDLSSNHLSKDSHLEVLNSFNLEMLDLSSNEIEDVSMISNLDSIPEINLHNQIFTAVKIVNIDVTEDSDNQTEGDFELPQILSYASPLISDWIVEIHSDVEGDTDQKAYVNWSHFDSHTIRIVIGEKTLDGYKLYKSMITLKFKITDTTNELYNSEITVHYVVTDSDEQGIYIPDKNLYKAIKLQLTDGQNENNDLISYFREDDDTRRNLYERAYDDAQVLVITVDDIVNEINSLILRDKKIKNMEGIQYFYGLSSNLDVTGNYIKSIDKFIELQHMQEEKEQELRNKVSKQLDLVSEIINKIISERKSIESNNDRLGEIDSKLAELRGQLASETDQSKIDAINSNINTLVEERDGILESLAASQNKLQLYYPIFVKRMEKLYKIYNRIDYLTSLATNDVKTFDEEKDLEDLTKDDAKRMVQAQINRIASLESLEMLTPFETSYLIKKYNIPTEREVQTSQGTEIKPIKNPIGTFFKEYVEIQFEDITLTQIARMITSFREDDFYMSLYNYCYITRYFKFEEDCVAEEYAIEEALKSALDDYVISFMDFNPYYWEVNPMEIIDYRTNMKQYMIDCLNNYQSLLDEYSMTCEGPLYDDGDVDPVTGELVHVFDELIFMYARQMVRNKGEISTYVNLPRLKVLNVSENLIEEIDNLAELTELRRFIAYDNEIVDISNVDWGSMEYLRKLNLGFNEISDITPLEAATKLVFLCASRNLLSGEFTFDLSKLEDLMMFDVSRNKIDSIHDLLAYLSFELRAANQNVPEIDQYQNIGDFLSDPDTISIDLRGQQLALKVENPVLLGTQMKVELPPIYAQSEEADPAGTSFSISSTFGNVTTDGKYAILDTSSVGTKQSIVYIDSRDSVRDGLTETTTCQILYKVVDSLELIVEVTPETADVLKGGTQQFECTVTGASTNAVLWTVSGNTSENTVISGNGLLTVGEDETAEQLVVKATSLYDEISSDTAVVNVVNKGVSRVVITPETANTIKGGETVFTATVEGENLEDEDKEVDFEIDYDDHSITPSTDTTFVQNGNVLTVTIGENEDIPSFKITAKSKKDANKTATATLTVQNKSVEEITISPTSVELEKGNTQTFTVNVLGDNLEDADKEVVYTLSGNNKAGTKIYPDGTLVIDPEETARTITVTAKSKSDPSKKVVATVTIAGNTEPDPDPEDPEDPEAKVVTSVTITPATAEVEKGATKDFVATVNGNNLTDADKQVTYTVAGNNSTKTKVYSDGTLVVGSDETATTLTVTATSKLNPSKKAVATVTVKSGSDEPDHPTGDIKLGYTVDGDYLVDVKTKTPLDVFKSKLAPGYTVVVKDENGNTVSSGNVKTGMFAQVQDENGNVIKDENGDLYVFEIAVKGDVNKDGLADSRDSNLIKAHRNEIYTLEGAAARAADIDDKNGIDAKDSKLLLYHRAEVTGYSLDYNG